MSAELKELAEIIRRLPPQKLELLLDYARDLADEVTAEDLAEFEAGMAEIARGEWVDWDELRKELGL